MTNSLQWWKDAIIGKVAPIDPNEPARGWYRTRRKGQPYVPVAYWYEDDQLFCLMDGKNVDEQRAREYWPYISKNPIKYEVYQAVAERGEAWPDIDSTVADQQKPAGVGDNRAPSDPAEILAEQIASASAGAKDYDSITSDAQAAKAQTLRSRLLELSGQADTHRETLKAPHLEAGRAIDAKWQPLVKNAKAFADKIRAALGAWETAKLRKAQAEAAEAARKAQEAFQAQSEAAKAGTAPPPSLPLEPPPTPYVPTTIRGAAGRAASTKPKRVVTAITNIDAVFATMKGKPEVHDVLLRLAQRAVDAGQDVLGCRVEEQMKVV